MKSAFYVADMWEGLTTSPPIECQATSLHGESRLGNRDTVGGKWWAVTGSNRRHPRCKRGALPAELTAQNRYPVSTFTAPGHLLATEKQKKIAGPKEAGNLKTTSGNSPKISAKTS